MSFDFYVAIHAADWPTPAALNRCLGELKYPVRLVEMPEAVLDKPLGVLSSSPGFAVTFEKRRVELEVEVTRLGPGSSYAFTPSIAPTFSKSGTAADGTPYGMQFYAMTQDTGAAAFVPRDLNADLRGLGVPSPDYKDGDYVVTFSFRADKTQYRAGSYVMAGLIRCSKGFGFEYQQGSFGTDDFADGLLEAAAGAKHRR